MKTKDLSGLVATIEQKYQDLYGRIMMIQGQPSRLVVKSIVDDARVIGQLERCYVARIIETEADHQKVKDACDLADECF